MSLVSSLLSSSGAYADVNTSAIEARFGAVTEDFLENASSELMMDIAAVNEAYLTADIIGSVKVITEGADPEVLLENIVTSAAERIKGAWNKFLAAVRKFFDKVITFFKSMVLTGEKFVKELGGKIRDKINSIGKYEYTGYLYDESKGNAMYDSAKSSIEKEITKYFQGFDSLTAIRDVNGADLKIQNLTEDDDASTIVEKAAGDAVSGATYAGDIKAEILDKYRGEKEAHTIGSTEVGKMLDVVKGAKKAIDAAKNDKKKMEDTIIKIINKCDKIGNNIKDDKEKEKVITKAGKLSTILNGLLNLYRGAADAKITYYKESNRHYLGVLRKLLNFGKKATTESATLFEGDDVDPDDAGDIDEDDIDFEAAIAGADEVEGDTSDIGLVKESYGGFNGNSIITEAMSFLNR